MDWQEEYSRKLVTAEEAVSIVKSGDRVAIPEDMAGGPVALAEALAARLGELSDVKLHLTAPLIDPGWFQTGLEESFKVTVQSYVTGVARSMIEERRGDYSPRMYSLWGKAEIEGRPGVSKTDICMTVVSPPDRNGFCSFGFDIWSKKWYCQNAKTVVVEIDKNYPRTYGDNFIHVSEIDYFVESDRPPLARRMMYTPEEHAETIGQYVGTLVKDGDTIGIGAGPIGSALCNQRVFDGKHDLGYHAENIVTGLVRLVKEGIVNGKRKTFHPGKVVANNFLVGDTKELEFIQNNPIFELYPQEYVLDIINVAANDNMVFIGSALSIDFTGQIASESIGSLMLAGSGGQPELAIGAMLSKGGRFIIMLPSTARGGKISRIVPSLELGTIVTIPRNFADYVVSEYGIASLLGKSQRERAGELISVAHPDFRGDLRKQAQKLFWP